PRQVERRGHEGHDQHDVGGLDPEIALHGVRVPVGTAHRIAREARRPVSCRPMDKTYDQAYFDRWYRDGGIGGRQRLARKVALAVATAEYHLERPLKSVLDIGCGEGAW